MLPSRRTLPTTLPWSLRARGSLQGTGFPPERPRRPSEQLIFPGKTEVQGRQVSGAKPHSTPAAAPGLRLRLASSVSEVWMSSTPSAR